MEAKITRGEWQSRAPLTNRRRKNKKNGQPFKGPAPTARAFVTDGPQTQSKGKKKPLKKSKVLKATHPLKQGGE